MAASGRVIVAQWWLRTRFILRDMTVSWRHAELRPSAGHWVLVDLGSKNGTHVNGWRAGAGFTVRPGDWVRFGRARFRITG